MAYDDQPPSGTKIIRNKIILNLSARRFSPRSYRPLAMRGTTRDVVARHPRLVGALFTLSLLLVQVGAVVADAGGSGGNGP